jgi:hypothetical protein
MEAKLYKLNNSEKVSGYTHWLQLKAKSLTERTPVHIIAVIDTSASMEEESKLENVKKSMNAIIDFLGATDKFSLITFSSSSDILASRVEMTDDNKYKMRQIINTITADMCTNISAGLLNAFECEEGGTTHKTSIILLTDGEANRGVTSPDAITDLINNGSDANTSIHTFGYGFSHNSRLLTMISEENTGSYNVVNNLEDVASSIGNTFGSIVCCVVQNVRVMGESTMEFYSGYPINGVNVKIGDMIADSEVGILIKDTGSASPNDNINIVGYNINGGTGNININLKLATDILEGSDETDTSAYNAYMRLKVAEYIEKPPSIDDLNEFKLSLEGADDIINIIRGEIDNIIQRLSVPPVENNVFFGNMMRAPIRDDTTYVRNQNVTFFRTLRTIYTSPQAGPPGGSDNDSSTPSVPRGYSVLTPSARAYSEGVYMRATQHTVDDSDVDPASTADPATISS